MLTDFQNSLTGRPQTPPLCCHLWVVTLSTRQFLVAIGPTRRDMMCKHDVINIQHALCGLVGTDCMQEVVPSVRCLQRAFLRAKPRLRACEPHCLSLAATSSSQLPCANMTSSTKPEIRNVSLRRHRKAEPRPKVTCTKNLAKIGRVVTEI